MLPARPIRRRLRRLLALMALLVPLLSVWPRGPAGAAPPPTEAEPRSGAFTLLTYNVAGLPELVSQSHPSLNIPVIGNLLNLYDVAVVQEDFAYHESLAAAALHRYRSEPLSLGIRTGIGDGLSVFSRLPFTRFEHVPWVRCHGKFKNGSDCLAPKGFTVATHEVAPGVEIDVYNLHMDSGGARGDVQARAAQAGQLLAMLQRRSTGRAVIVAGDTNMGQESEDVLATFLRRAALTDACRSLECGRPRLIDRIMFRGSRTLELRAESFLVDPRFVQNDGRALSDHEAVGVAFSWSRGLRLASAERGRGRQTRRTTP